MSDTVHLILDISSDDRYFSYLKVDPYSMLRGTPRSGIENTRKEKPLFQDSLFIAFHLNHSTIIEVYINDTQAPLTNFFEQYPEYFI